MHRLLGSAAIVLGVAILVLDADRWDVVLASLTSSHGVHLSDLIGVTLVALGIVSLWIAPSR